MTNPSVYVLPLVFELREEHVSLHESLGLSESSYEKMMSALDGQSTSVLLNLLSAHKKQKIDDKSIAFLLAYGALTFFDLHSPGWRLTHPDPIQDLDTFSGRSDSYHRDQ